jgi:hypothetical protein
MDTPTRTTELEAVNTMLAILGEAPVNTLVPPYGVDVAEARNLIYETSKSVQSMGWAFNSEEQYTLAPDSAGAINLPSNMLAVDADTETAFDIVQRGSILYDRKGHTSTFTRSVKCEVIWMFPFDEIPETARQYIMIKAGRKLQARFVGSELLHKFSEHDETMALVNLMNAEANSADINILNDPSLMYITRRNSPRRFGNVR